MDDSWINQSVYSAFHRTAKNYGSHKALVAQKVTLSYSQLLKEIDRCALALKNYYLKEKEPIAIWLPNDDKFIICMFAINSLGSPYLPLDNNFPILRNLKILNHSKIRKVIYTGIPPSDRVDLEWIDIEELLLAESADHYYSEATKDDLSYIIYTSGSTGDPKGVYQNQRNLLHDVSQYIEATHLNADDRCTLLYSPSVNGAIRDIYGTLLSGATLYISNLKTDGIAVLGKFINTHQITVYHSLPGIFRAFLALQRSMFQSVRMVYLAGDRIYSSDLSLFKRFFPNGAKMYVGIGSTENATIYCQWLLDHDTVVTQLLLPLGYPVKNREFKIIKADGQVADYGEDGEITVTSEFMSLGYWNDKVLTAASFVPNENNTRTFRTGDYGRILSNNMLHFLGRKDNQVKINGYRIEVDEVNEIVNRQSGVKKAAVLTIGEENTVRLIAFIELNDSESNSENIKKSLAAELPAHMMPAKFLVLNHIPLLDNYKIDRNALLNLYNTSTPVKEIVNSVNVITTIEQTWIKYIEESSGYDDDLSFAQSGTSSIDVVYLSVELEKLLDIEIPAEYINTSLKPSVLTKLILNQKNNISRHSDYTAYTIYVFCPLKGLSFNQISFIKRLSPHMSTIIIEYPLDDDQLINSNLIQSRVQKVIDKYFEHVELSNSIFLGICNGNILAQAVAAQLPLKNKPLVHVNIDSPVSPAAFSSLYSRFYRMFRTIKRHGLISTIADVTLVRLSWLKKINSYLYFQITANLIKHSNQNVKDVHLINQVINYKATGIPILFISGYDNRNAGVDIKYGWQRFYTVVEIKELPYSHHNLIAFTDAQDIIINSIKTYLSALVSK